MGDVSSQAVKGMKYRARGTNPLHGFLLGLLISFGLTVFYKRMNHSLTVEGVGNGGGGGTPCSMRLAKGVSRANFFAESEAEDHSKQDN